MIEQLFQNGEVRSALLFMNENDRVSDVCDELEKVMTCDDSHSLSLVLLLASG